MCAWLVVGNMCSIKYVNEIFLKREKHPCLGAVNHNTQEIVKRHITSHRELLAEDDDDAANYTVRGSCDHNVNYMPTYNNRYHILSTTINKQMTKLYLRGI